MSEINELVEAAQAGDDEAYAALARRFQPMAYALAYRYLRDHHLAQDLVQEALIEAFVALPRLREPAAFPGWFRQIVFRQCTRVLRQTSVSSTSLATMNDGLCAENDPADLAIQGEMQARVRAAVANLPRHERLVTVLFYGRQYSYNEISSYLHIPLTTVKKRLHSARQRLKAQLQSIIHDEIARARGSSDEAAGAAIGLAPGRNWLKMLFSPWWQSITVKHPGFAL